MRELYDSYKHRDSTTILWRKWCINCSFPQSKLANVGETETCFPWRKFTWIWESNHCWTGSPKSFDLDCLITNHGRTEEPSTSKRHCATSRDPNILDQKSIHEDLTLIHGWQAGSGVRMIENVIRWLLTSFGPRGVGCVDASGASKGSAPELGSWSRSVKAHWQKPSFTIFYILNDKTKLWETTFIWPFVGRGLKANVTGRAKAKVLAFKAGPKENCSILVLWSINEDLGALQYLILLYTFHLYTVTLSFFWHV